jgi:RNA polymerase sigma-70 factor, ECF subfamily
MKGCIDAASPKSTHLQRKNHTLSKTQLMQDGSETALVRAGEDGSAGEGTPPVEAPAFEHLYQLYFGFTWRVLGHLGVSAHGIDDAVQEVWLTVHRRLDSFASRSELKTWLFGIALNVARNQRRAESRRSKHLPDAPSGATPLDPELIHEGHEAWERVQRFLATLDEQPRAIFVCNLLENLSATETAEATHVDVTTVYKRVRSLRQSFRTWLAREFEGEGRRP